MGENHKKVGTITFPFFGEKILFLVGNIIRVLSIIKTKRSTQHNQPLLIFKAPIENVTCIKCSGRCSRAGDEAFLDVFAPAGSVVGEAVFAAFLIPLDRLKPRPEGAGDRREGDADARVRPKWLGLVELV